MFRCFSEAVGLSPSDANTVSCYIIATKRHDVSDSEDQDMRAFIDLDMAVVGRERTAYFTYASQVKAHPVWFISTMYICARFSYPERNNICFRHNAYTAGLLLLFAVTFIHAFICFSISSRGGCIVFYFFLAVPMALHDTGMGIHGTTMDSHGNAIAVP